MFKDKKFSLLLLFALFAAFFADVGGAVAQSKKVSTADVALSKNNLVFFDSASLALSGDIEVLQVGEKCHLRFTSAIAAKFAAKTPAEIAAAHQALLSAVISGKTVYAGVFNPSIGEQDVVCVKYRSPSRAAISPPTPTPSHYTVPMPPVCGSSGGNPRL